MPLVFGVFGLIMLSYPASAVISWFNSPDNWTQFYLTNRFDDAIVLRPEVLAIILGLTLAATLIWAGIAYLFWKKAKWEKAAVFCSGTNLALVFGQFTDASATFIAIDYYSYWEKHVVPSFLIDVLDTAAVMFILKVIALFFAIYVLDIMLKKELEKYRQIVPLIKIAILVLGLAPGIRDMLRLAMGV